jgi:hypothetical protein
LRAVTVRGALHVEQSSVIGRVGMWYTLPTMRPDQQCAGKTVLVTGAQRGIGRAVALRFAQA